MERLCRDPSPFEASHVAHVYHRRRSLVRAVVGWIGPCLETGGAAVLVCTPAHAAAIRRALREEGLDATGVETEGRLVVLDAEATLAQFLVDGRPVRARFLPLARAAIGRARRATRDPNGEVRAWGEMVNLLWQRGDPAAAQALETLWTEVVAQENIRLLCSYAPAHPDTDAHRRLFRDVERSHESISIEADPDGPGHPPALPSALASALAEWTPGWRA